MKLGFGMISAQHHPDDLRDDAEIYSACLTLAERAEALGFDSVWLSEHHFVDDGYMPSLLPLAAAIAARTSRIEIGTGLLLAPFHNPIRLAEDAATVDLLSRGRLILGVGTGWREEEFEGFDVANLDLGESLEGTVTVLRNAWTRGGGIRIAGGQTIAVTPKPYMDAGPPIWIGARRPGGIRRTARLADGYLAARVSPEELGQNVAILHEALAKEGRDRADVTVGVHTPVFASPDGDAWEKVRDYLHYVEWKYDDMRRAYGDRTQLSAVPPLTAARERELMAGAIVGTPDEVAVRIREYADAAGPPFHFIARLYWPGIDAAVQLEALECFARDVIPQLADEAPSSRADRGLGVASR